MPHLSDEDRAHTKARGIAFAHECADLTDHTFRAALAAAMQLIKQVLEQDAVNPTLTAEAALTFSVVAIAERRRLFLIAARPVGSA